VKIDIKYVADLARLKLSAEEESRYTEQLSDILVYINKLNELDTAGVEPTSHALVLKNIMREDEPRASGMAGEIMKNAPESESGYFKVKKVIE
jgi:aspartyl-tRNA(Asn)/glutamyl-tRNA(Gln) amidotransferase subunit C